MEQFAIKRGKVYNVPLTNIKVVPGYNVRFIFNEADEIGLRNSVKENGVRVALVGRNHGEGVDGTETLRAGHRRFRAALCCHLNYAYPSEREGDGMGMRHLFAENVLSSIFELGMRLGEAIEAATDEIGEPDPEGWGWEKDMRELSFTTEGIGITDEGRIFDLVLTNDGKSLDLYEQGKVYADLCQIYNHTPSSIARKVGKTPQHVSNAIAVWTAPDNIKRAIESGEITSGGALALIQQNGKDNTEALTEGLKEAKANARVDKKSGKAKPAGPSAVKGPSIGKVWNQGKRFIESDVPVNVQEPLGKLLELWGKGEFGMALEHFQKLTGIE